MIEKYENFLYNCKYTAIKEAEPMKRREFIKLAAGILGYFAFGDMFSKNISEAADLKKAYHIVLISDLHLPWRSKNFPQKTEGQNIFEQKKKMLQNINGWQDAKEVALLGDFPARYGNEEEFLSVDEFLNEISLPKYIAIGNHDYAYRDKPSKKGKLKRGTHEEQQKKLNAFKERYKMPALYYTRTVLNYRLIYLAPDACDKLNVELSQKQLEWLQGEIASHANSPIIFFCHAPLKNTLLNYHKSINTPKATAQPEQALEEILKLAPKGSLWISGHTHTPKDNPSFANDDINRYNDRIINIHNPTIDSKQCVTNSLFLLNDRAIVKTFDHKKNIWLENFTREYRF